MKFRVKWIDWVDVVDILSGVLMNSNLDFCMISDEFMFFIVGGEYYVIEMILVYLEYNLVMGEYLDVLVFVDLELNGLFLGMRYSFGKIRGDLNKGVYVCDGCKWVVMVCDLDF